MLMRITDVTVYCDHILAHDRDGREFMRPHGGDFDIAALRESMEVDVSQPEWLVRAPYGTNAWFLDGEEDRLIEDERF